MPQNSAFIKYDLQGIEGLKAALSGIPKEIEDRVLADMVREGAKPIVRHIKQRVPVDEGNLKKSITSVVKKSKKTGVAFAVVGPSTARFSGGKKLKKGASWNGAARPALYAHLVEFGHHSAAATGVSVRSAKGTTIRKGTLTPRSFIMPKPFMRPGTKAAQPEVAANMTLGFQKGLTKAAKRYADKRQKG